MGVSEGVTVGVAVELEVEVGVMVGLGVWEGCIVWLGVEVGLATISRWWVAVGFVAFTNGPIELTGFASFIGVGVLQAVVSILAEIKNIHS